MNNARNSNQSIVRGVVLFVGIVFWIVGIYFISGLLAKSNVDRDMVNISIWIPTALLIMFVGRKLGK